MSLKYSSMSKERNSDYEYTRKNGNCRHRRDADRPARQQTRRAEKIDGGLSCLGGAPRNGRCRVNEKGFRWPRIGGDLYDQSFTAFLAGRSRGDSRHHAGGFARRRQRRRKLGITAW